MRIDIEEIRKITERRHEINRLPLDEIEFYENGEKVEIDKELMERFIDIGLSNIDFITSEYYKKTK